MRRPPQRRATAARLIVGVLLGALLLASCAEFSDIGAGSKQPPPSVLAGTAGEATLVRVVDGDTVVVDLDGAEERIRLIGIDTPESVDPNRPVECFGPEASAYMAELLPPETRILLELDVEARDRYGRLLAYIYRADDGLFINAEMVAAGYASVYTFPPNVTYVDTFRTAERAAREGGLGLWTGCPAE